MSKDVGGGAIPTETLQAAVEKGESDVRDDRGNVRERRRQSKERLAELPWRPIVTDSPPPTDVHL